MCRSAPLYVVAWRALWMPLFVVGAVSFGLGILLAFGPKALVASARYVFK